jgi:hypothetical protein
MPISQGLASHRPFKRCCIEDRANYSDHIYVLLRLLHVVVALIAARRAARPSCDNTKLCATSGLPFESRVIFPFRKLGGYL